MIRSIKNWNKRPLWVFFLSMAFCCSGLLNMEITRINCRFALMTGEIGVYGTGLFPTLNGAYYTDYPVTLVYLMHLASLGGRCINMLTLALPTAILASLTVTATYLVGEKVRRDLGFFAAVFLFFSYEFINIARAPGIDMAVAASASWMIYFLFSAEHDRNWKYYLGVPFCAVAAFAFRGPFGLVLLDAALAGYFLATLNWKKILAAGVASLILSVLLLYLGYLAIHKAGGEKLWGFFYNDQIASRMEAGKWCLYFFADAAASYALTYALGLAVFAFSLKKLLIPRKDERGAVKFLRRIFGWAILPLLILSIPGTKHLRYASCVIPALSLAAAWGFMNFDNNVWFERGKKLLLKVCALLPFVCTLAAAAMIAISWVLFGKSRFGLVAFGIMMILLLLFIRNRYTAEKRLLLLGAVFFSLLVSQIISPFDAKCQNAADFVRRAMPFIEGKTLYFYRLGPDGDEHKFMVNLPPEKRFVPRYLQVVIHDSYRERGMFRSWGEADAAAQLGPESVLLARIDKLEPLAPDDDLKALSEKYEILQTGKMGHRHYVLFRKKTP